eukprot:CAMPEP_0115352748 /NCGR_PEP_ID=MMETSP0270-20121206/97670_1 /TAXON_ID=71861 /ORGANISM="Scrippsiella trochoidea, Strain CCMP3099" /LENGTH=50 /DNA_ID=CAMNT_0002774939 /DNA_START=456 /DNA_END=608 /DNA_ORIENTATION=+
MKLSSQALLYESLRHGGKKAKKELIATTQMSRANRAPTPVKLHSSALAKL